MSDKPKMIVPDLVSIAAQEGNKLRMPRGCRPIVIVVDEDGNAGFVSALPQMETVAALHLVMQSDDLDPSKRPH